MEGTNCDSYALTIAGTQADWVAAAKQVHVQINGGLPSSDYDLYVHKGDLTGPVVASSGSAGTTSEQVDLNPASSSIGTGLFTVHVVYYAATQADQYTGVATLLSAGSPAIPAPTPAAGFAPRYETFTPPAAGPATLGLRAGEPSIGIGLGIAGHPEGRALFQADVQTLRVTFNDPCNVLRALWEDKSPPTSQVDFDPILFTDRETGRTVVHLLTFAGQVLAGESLRFSAGWRHPPGWCRPKSNTESCTPSPHPLSLCKNSLPPNLESPRRAFLSPYSSAPRAVYSHCSASPPLPAQVPITVPGTSGQTVSVTWAGTIPALVNGTSDCTNVADTPLSDQHLPTIIVPAGVYNNVNAKFTFNISWDGAAGNDEVLTVLNPNGTALDSSDGGDPSETVTANNLPDGTYKVVACGFISGPAGQPYVGKLTIDTTSGGPPPPPPTPTPAPAAPGVPRYYNYSAPPAVGENAGEPSIGYNLTTHKAMYISGLETFRVTFPETGACAALWEDVSSVITSTKSLDPILFTDQFTGRTFVSQLNSVVPPASPVLVGLNSLMAYTDDDGANWTVAQVNPPDGSYDHQTVGGGPYPASVPLGNPANRGSAVYYCSQAGVTAFCSRSDDGGLNFGPSRAIYNAVTDGCGGIHGHVKVAPDGTVYVPNRGCNSVQAVTVSEDAGVTWTVRQVQGPGFTAGPPPGILDPTVGIASDGTLYFSYVNTDGHAHVAVSHDKGATWINDRDIGVGQNVGNAVFLEAVAGDPNRAAVGFVGTTQTGDHQATDFNGDWYVYMAHTYDGGMTWTTVNATPNDPVQRSACIWNQGGSNACRNLLDFNEITKDEKGRVLYSYADGCVGDCVSGGSNSFSSKATIARQSGGNGLLQAFDPVEPTGPQSACLSGRRDDQASYLRWVAPDNGGSDITIYKILRGLTPGTEVEIGQQVGNKTTYNDRNADPAVASYSYKIIAVNGQGVGQPSNNVVLTVSPRVSATGACLIPGVEILTDPTGDATDTNAQHDITSISVAEPLSNATTGDASNLYFTIKVANLTPPVLAGWRWSIRFTVPGFPPPAHPVLGAQEDWQVSMDTADGPNPVFTYGTTGVFQGAARVFVTLGNLDPASSIRPDGTITLVLPKSAFPGIQPGQAINIALGSVRATVPSTIPGTGGTNETIPDTTGGTSYTLRPSNLCLPNAAPFAQLTASPANGIVPLAVALDGITSTDEDAIDSIASYTFNFGDGTDDVVQTSPLINHTFAQAGLYDVKLVVTDSRGKVSSNTAHQLVQVLSPLTGVVSRKLHNGVPFDIDLPIDGSASGIECRTGPVNGAHQLIYTFARNLTAVGSPSVSSGTGTAVGAMGPAANQYTVNLTGVPNASYAVVSLQNVQDTSGATFNASVRMGVLLGDVNASGTLNSTDIGLAKANSGQTTNGNTFRTDVNSNGVINSTDIGLIKAQSGGNLPANPEPERKTAR